MSHVTEHLAKSGVEHQVLPHPTTQTARTEARVLGIPEDEVAKTIVLDVRTGHAFAVIPADARVDLEAVREALGSRNVSLASEDEIRRDYPEFELGAIPPLGALVHTPLIVDSRVVAHDQVVFAAGTREESVRMRTEDLLRPAMYRIADICC